MARKARLCILVAALMWPTAYAAADIYTYRTPDGELLVTTSKRSDLELVDVVRSGRSTVGATTKSDKRRAKRERNIATAKANRERYTSKRASVVPMPAKARAKRNAYDDLITEASRAYGVPFAFIKAVITVESSFNARAISRAGAQGLMQLMPATAARLHVRDPFDPRQNVFGGTKLLRILIDRYDGDINLVLSAYNAGDRAVSRAGGIPFKATRAYVASIYRWYKVYQAKAQ